jgi:TP901 family phage tail tape measure protein
LRDVYQELEKTDKKITPLLDRFKEGGLAYSGFFMAGKGLASAVIKDFGDLEDAQNKLKSTLMDSSGHISSYYGKIAIESDKLGAALPGTAADFYNMSSSLKSLGVSEQSIVGGALKSSAYLATVMKISYQDAAEATAKFKQAFGIADKDLLPFIDDIQRMGNMGVKVEEMKFAFSKIGATMKGVGLDGLKAARDVEPLIGLLIKGGASGETVGTNLGSMIDDSVKFKGSKSEKNFNSLNTGIKLDFADEKGNFKGVNNMIHEIQKLKNIKSDVVRVNAIEAIFGKGEAASMAKTLMVEGTAGVEKFSSEMKKQADINQRAKIASEGLNNTWEALTGTAANLAATIGASIAPELKGLTNFFNSATDGITKFSKAHPTLTHNVALLTGSIIAVSGILGITALGINALTYGFTAMGIKTLFATTTQWFFNTSLGKSFLTMGWVIGRMVIMGGILGGMAIKTGLVTAAQWLLNGAMLANPVGLLVVGFTALVGIGVLLYKNFLPFKNLIDGINQSIDHVMGKDGWLGKLATLGIDAPAAPKFPNTPKPTALVPSAPKFPNTPKPTALVPSAPRRATIPALKKREPIHQTTTNHINVVVHNPSKDVDVVRAVQRSFDKKTPIGYGDRV